MWWMHLVAALGFLFFEAVGIWMWLSSRTRREPVPVPARILESELAVRQERVSSGRLATIYTPKVRFSYEYEGRRYESGDIGDGILSTPEGLRRTVAKYPAGAEAQAWVDPAEPARAVLQRGGGTSLFSLLLCAGGVLWLAILEALVWKQR